MTIYLQEQLYPPIWFIPFFHFDFDFMEYIFTPQVDLA